ncbi:MAG: hypothetical protein JRE64_27770 [Deltaproteobacteria bacterium]|nr:hypothetical protein [Deltaproteobacteria bacterium]
MISFPTKISMRNGKSLIRLIQPTQKATRLISSYFPEKSFIMKKKETTIKKQLDTPREAKQRYQHLIDNLKNEYFFYTHDTAGVFTHVSPSERFSVKA